MVNVEVPWCPRLQLVPILSLNHILPDFVQRDYSTICHLKHHPGRHRGLKADALLPNVDQPSQEVLIASRYISPTSPRHACRSLPWTVAERLPTWRAARSSRPECRRFRSRSQVRWLVACRPRVSKPRS